MEIQVQAYQKNIFNHSSLQMKQTTCLVHIRDDRPLLGLIFQPTSSINPRLSTEISWKYIFAVFL